MRVIRDLLVGLKNFAGDEKTGVGFFSNRKHQIQI